jgi:hypothetical protein
MFDLKQTQDFFWRLMQSPGGTSDISKTGGDLLEKIFSEKREGEALERLENYSQMYFWRLSDSLKEDFPLTMAVMGEKDFHILTVEYLLRSPSRFRDLAEFSGVFPDFLQRNPKIWSVRWPFLVELAGFEWKLIAVQRERDPHPLTRESLSRLAPESWAGLSLRRIQASQLFPVHWDFIPGWKDHRMTPPPPKIGHLLLWRKKFTPMVLEISPQEADLLNLLKTPTSFQDLCEKIHQSNPQEAPRQAVQYLHSWIERELVEGC